MTISIYLYYLAASLMHKQTMLRAHRATREMSHKTALKSNMMNSNASTSLAPPKKKKKKGTFTYYVCVCLLMHTQGLCHFTDCRNAPATLWYYNINWLSCFPHKTNNILIKFYSKLYS